MPCFALQQRGIISSPPRSTLVSSRMLTENCILKALDIAFSLSCYNFLVDQDEPDNVQTKKSFRILALQFDDEIRIIGI